MTRTIRSAALWGVCLAVATLAQAQEQSDFRVTLLGTGGPPPDPNRLGPATLVEAGDQTLLFDVGRGAPIRLWQIRVPLREIDATFLTHLHSDHTVGIPDVWLSGWLGGPFARRTTPFRIIGPPGTMVLMSNLEEAYRADIDIRMADEGYPIEGVNVAVEEFDEDGIIYEQSDVRVTAFEVDHGEHVKPAYGFRIEYGGRSVVISGDTKYSEAVIKHGEGADLIIHEVGAVRPELLADQQVQRVMDHHTSPQEAGRIFAQTQPQLGVYTHLVLLARGEVPAVTSEELIAQTRETYDGPLEVGEDLMTLHVGHGAVAVERRSPDPPLSE